MNNDAFVERILETRLTRRQIQLLEMMEDGSELLVDGNRAVVETDFTNVATVYALMRCCAISLRSGDEFSGYYAINETGRELLKRNRRG